MSTKAPDSIADRVKEALLTGGFILYGQVILPLAAGEPERPFREILIRFREEEEKMLPPGSFFPVLEENGLLPALDRWVVDYLVKRAQAEQAGKRNLPLTRNSINLAADTLQDEKFLAYAFKRVSEAKLPKGTVSFEFSWAAATEYAKLLQALMLKLKPAGCAFSIAGFDGSEEAFHMIHAQRPDYVKFNYGLVQNIARSLADSERAEAVNARCHEMGIKTIAEYVESAVVLDHLKLIGVDYAQGLAISPPQALK